MSPEKKKKTNKYSFKKYASPSPQKRLLQLSFKIKNTKSFKLMKKNCFNIKEKNNFKINLKNLVGRLNISFLKKKEFQIQKLKIKNN